MYPRNAIIDVAERPCLLAVTPNVNFIQAFKLCSCNFTTQRCRRSLSSIQPRCEWAEDVVKSNNPSLKSVFQPIMNAEAFTQKLFPSVRILRCCWIGIFLLQGKASRCCLPALRIDACRRRIQVSSDTVLPRRFDAMKVD